MIAHRESCRTPNRMHLDVSQRSWSLLSVLAVLLVSGCDSYGLPAYQVFTTTPPEGQSGAGILDIDPKLARAGETVEITVTGFKTSFSDQTTVSFPDEPELVVQSVVAESFERLRFVLVIGIRADSGTRALEITTPADGTLLYVSGFTVVQ